MVSSAYLRLLIFLPAILIPACASSSPSVSQSVQSLSCVRLFADDTTLMAESEEKLKSLLMKVKEESEKLA